MVTPPKKKEAAWSPSSNNSESSFQKKISAMSPMSEKPRKDGVTRSSSTSRARERSRSSRQRKNSRQDERKRGFSSPPTNIQAEKKRGFSSPPIRISHDSTWFYKRGRSSSKTNRNDLNEETSHSSIFDDLSPDRQAYVDRKIRRSAASVKVEYENLVPSPKMNTASFSTCARDTTDGTEPTNSFSTYEKDRSRPSASETSGRRLSVAELVRRLEKSPSKLLEDSPPKRQAPPKKCSFADEGGLPQKKCSFAHEGDSEWKSKLMKPKNAVFLSMDCFSKPRNSAGKRLHPRPLLHPPAKAVKFTRRSPSDSSTASPPGEALLVNPTTLTKKLSTQTKKLEVQRPEPIDTVFNVPPGTVLPSPIEALPSVSSAVTQTTRYDESLYQYDTGNQNIPHNSTTDSQNIPIRLDVISELNSTTDSQNIPIRLDVISELRVHSDRNQGETVTRTSSPPKSAQECLKKKFPSPVLPSPAPSESSASLSTRQQSYGTMDSPGWRSIFSSGDPRLFALMHRKTPCTATPEAEPKREFYSARSRHTVRRDSFVNPPPTSPEYLGPDVDRRTSFTSVPEYVSPKKTITAVSPERESRCAAKKLPPSPTFQEPKGYLPYFQRMAQWPPSFQSKKPCPESKSAPQKSEVNPVLQRQSLDNFRREVSEPNLEQSLYQGEPRYKLAASKTAVANTFRKLNNFTSKAETPKFGDSSVHSGSTASTPHFGRESDSLPSPPHTPPNSSAPSFGVTQRSGNFPVPVHPFNQFPPPTPCRPEALRPLSMQQPLREIPKSDRPCYKGKADKPMSPRRLISNVATPSRNIHSNVATPSRGVHRPALLSQGSPRRPSQGSPRRPGFWAVSPPSRDRINVSNRFGMQQPHLQDVAAADTPPRARSTAVKQGNTRRRASEPTAQRRVCDPQFNSMHGNRRRELLVPNSGQQVGSAPRPSAHQRQATFVAVDSPFVSCDGSVDMDISEPKEDKQIPHMEVAIETDRREICERACQTQIPVGDNPGNLQPESVAQARGTHATASYSTHTLPTDHLSNYAPATFGAHSTQTLPTEGLSDYAYATVRSTQTLPTEGLSDYAYATVRSTQTLPTEGLSDYAHASVHSTQTLPTEGLSDYAHATVHSTQTLPTEGLSDYALATLASRSTPSLPPSTDCISESAATVDSRSNCENPLNTDISDCAPTVDTCSRENSSVRESSPEDIQSEFALNRHRETCVPSDFATVDSRSRRESLLSDSGSPDLSLWRSNPPDAVSRICLDPAGFSAIEDTWSIAATVDSDSNSCAHTEELYVARLETDTGACNTPTPKERSERQIENEPRVSPGESDPIEFDIDCDLTGRAWAPTRKKHQQEEDIRETISRLANDDRSPGSISLFYSSMASPSLEMNPILGSDTQQGDGHLECIGIKPRSCSSYQESSGDEDITFTGPTIEMDPEGITIDSPEGNEPRGKRWRPSLGSDLHLIPTLRNTWNVDQAGIDWNTLSPSMRNESSNIECQDFAAQTESHENCVPSEGELSLESPERDNDDMSFLTCVSSHWEEEEELSLESPDQGSRPTSRSFSTRAPSDSEELSLETRNGSPETSALIVPSGSKESFSESPPRIENGESSSPESRSVSWLSPACSISQEEDTASDLVARTDALFSPDHYIENVLRDIENCAPNMVKTRIQGERRDLALSPIDVLCDRQEVGTQMECHIEVSRSEHPSRSPLKSLFESVPVAPIDVFCERQDAGTQMDCHIDPSKSPLKSLSESPNNQSRTSFCALTPEACPFYSPLAVPSPEVPLLSQDIFPDRPLVVAEQVESSMQTLMAQFASVSTPRYLAWNPSGTEKTHWGSGERSSEEKIEEIDLSDSCMPSPIGKRVRPLYFSPIISHQPPSKSPLRNQSLSFEAVVARCDRYAPISHAGPSDLFTPRQPKSRRPSETHAKSPSLRQSTVKKVFRALESRGQGKESRRLTAAASSREGFWSACSMREREERGKGKSPVGRRRKKTPDSKRKESGKRKTQVGKDNCKKSVKKVEKTRKDKESGKRKSIESVRSVKKSTNKTPDSKRKSIESGKKSIGMGGKDLDKARDSKETTKSVQKKAKECVKKPTQKTPESSKKSIELTKDNCKARESVKKTRKTPDSKRKSIEPAEEDFHNPKECAKRKSIASSIKSSASKPKDKKSAKRKSPASAGKKEGVKPVSSLQSQPKRGPGRPSLLSKSNESSSKARTKPVKKETGAGGFLYQYLSRRLLSSDPPNQKMGDGRSSLSSRVSEYTCNSSTKSKKTPEPSRRPGRAFLRSIESDESPCMSTNSGAKSRSNKLSAKEKRKTPVRPPLSIRSDTESSHKSNKSVKKSNTKDCTQSGKKSRSERPDPINIRNPKRRRSVADTEYSCKSDFSASSSPKSSQLSPKRQKRKRRSSECSSPKRSKWR